MCTPRGLRSIGAEEEEVVGEAMGEGERPKRARVRRAKVEEEGEERREMTVKLMVEFLMPAPCGRKGEEEEEASTTME